MQVESGHTNISTRKHHLLEAFYCGMEGEKTKTWSCTNIHESFKQKTLRDPNLREGPLCWFLILVCILVISTIYNQAKLMEPSK